MQTGHAKKVIDCGEAGAIDAPSAEYQIRHVKGTAEIMRHREVLFDFALKAGQPTAMSGLELLLHHSYTSRKLPHLFWIGTGGEPDSLSLDSLVGCALFFEYLIGPYGTGFLATGCSDGVGTVVAPEEIRAWVATVLTRRALHHARMVLASFRTLNGDIPVCSCLDNSSSTFTMQAREARDTLALQPSYDRTLSLLGKRTRNHLRYYRKRLQKETGCEFVRRAADRISNKDLAAINNASIQPIDQSVFDLRFHTVARSAGGYVHGLQCPDGRWLALAGGWRQGSTSLLEWQVNTAGLPHISITTAFRAYLIENEISLGTTQLRFHGGTPHSICNSFQHDDIVDIIARRSGPIPFVIERLMRAFANQPSVAKRGNLLIDALRHRDGCESLGGRGRSAPLGLQ